ncbi:MAG: glycine cleavage T C-terminal barrel domain-containing protein [Caldilineaceae bacterium]
MKVAAKENVSPQALLCDINRSQSEWHWAKEPIFHNGEAIGYFTSVDYGYSVGKLVGYAYLPVEHAGQARRWKCNISTAGSLRWSPKIHNMIPQWKN